MLRCPASKIHITADDIDDLSQRLRQRRADAIHATAQGRMNYHGGSKIHQKRYQTETEPTPNIKLGPQRSRNEGLVVAVLGHGQTKSIAAIRQHGHPTQLSNVISRSRHSVHAMTRPFRHRRPDIQRSRSSSGEQATRLLYDGWASSGVSRARGSAKPSEVRNRQEDHGNADSVFEHPTSSGSSSEATYCTAQTAVGGHHYADDFLPITTVKRSLSSSNEFKSVHRTIQSRRSSVGWSRTPREENIAISDIVSSASPESADTTPASRQTSLSYAHVRNTSPLEELANRLQRLAATPSIQKRQASRPSSRTSSVQPRLLSGEVFYTQPQKTLKTSSPATPAMHHSQALHLTPHSHDVYLNTTHATGAIYQSSPPAVASGYHSAETTSCHMPIHSSSPLPVTTTHAETSRSPKLPQTPGSHLMQAYREAPSTNHTKSRFATRVDVYDDERPAAVQPQTPADLGFRYGRSVRDPTKSLPAKRRRSRAVNDTMSSILPSTESRYPSLQNFPSTYDLRGRGTGSMDAGVGRAPTTTTPARRRHHVAPTRTLDQENNFDPLAHGLDFEREIWLQNRWGGGNADTLEATPPREGRFERFLR